MHARAAQQGNQLHKLCTAMTHADGHLMLPSCRRLPAPLEAPFEQA